MAVTFTMRVPLFALEGALEGLVAIDAMLIQAMGPRRAPHLYDSGILYRIKRGMRKKNRPEPWYPADELLRRGQGDCKDVAAYYAAWCRVFEAEPALVVVVPTGPLTVHAVVLHSDGTLEDPSAQLMALERGRRLYAEAHERDLGSEARWP